MDLKTIEDLLDEAEEAMGLIRIAIREVLFELAQKVENNPSDKSNSDGR